MSTVSLLKCYISSLYILVVIFKRLWMIVLKAAVMSLYCELHLSYVCASIVLEDWYLCECNTCRDTSGAISKCDSET